MDNDSVADQLNRGMFLAPDLIGEGEDDPLLEQAQENVEDEAEHAKDVAEKHNRDR